jgi:hypothetical protein
MSALLLQKVNVVFEALTKGISNGVTQKRPFASTRTKENCSQRPDVKRPQRPFRCKRGQNLCHECIRTEALAYPFCV